MVLLLLLLLPCCCGCPYSRLLLMSCMDWLTWPTMIEEGLRESCCELPIRLFWAVEEELMEEEEEVVPMMDSCEGWMEGMATLSSIRENWPPLEIGISIILPGFFF